MRSSFDVTKRDPGLRRGFTLVELLVAAGITLLLAGLIVGVTTHVLHSWNRAEGMVATEQKARAALDRLEQDLQGALCRDDGNVWLAATVQSAASASGLWIAGRKPIAESLNPAAAEFRDARFGVAGMWLRFFTASPAGGPTAQGPSAPVAVSYQIIRRSPVLADASPHYLLYRAEVAAPPTMTAGYDLVAPSYMTGSDVAGTPGSLVRPSPLQALADNTIDFGVRFYCLAPDTSDGAPALEQIFPTDAANLEHLARGASGEPHSRFPAVVDVLLRVLTEEGARQITALESGSISGDWWVIAEAHSRVFTRRVIIRAKLP